jgi:diguanylate cyclase (GGDEF)-like protein
VNLAPALRLPPWGNGRDALPGALALVPSLREALLPHVQPDQESDLEALLDEILFTLASLAIERDNRLVGLVSTDGLTGVLSRRAILRELEVEAARARRQRRPLTLLYLDVDHLKSVNDTFGHSAGDRALAMLTDAVQRHTRATDRIGRLSGDEFLLLLPDTPLEGAAAVADRLLQSVAPGAVSFSVGVAEFEPRSSPRAAVEAAEAAMRRAKGSGRGRAEVAPGVASAA